MSATVQAHYHIDHFAFFFYYYSCHTSTSKATISIYPQEATVHVTNDPSVGFEDLQACTPIDGVTICDVADG